MGTSVLLNAAARLLDVPEPKQPEAEWGEVTSRLARQGLDTDDWPPLTHDSADELSGLLLLVPRSKAVDIAKQATATSITEDGAEKWADGANVLLGRFEWLTMHVSGAPEAVRGALAHFATLQNWARLAGRLRVDPDARAVLDDAIVERIAQGPVEALNALKVLHLTEPEIDWATNTPAPAPTNTPIPSAVFVRSHTNYPQNGQYVVVGELVNGGAFDVFDVIVHGRFFDGAGLLIATAAAPAFFPKIEIERPSPFRLVVDVDPAAVNRYELSVTSDETSIVVRNLRK